MGTFTSTEETEEIAAAGSTSTTPQGASDRPGNGASGMSANVTTEISAVDSADKATRNVLRRRQFLQQQAKTAEMMEEQRRSAGRWNMIIEIMIVVTQNNSKK